MNPYISIIIPAYNEEDKIKDTLENIKDINEINEILVIDDGSSDKTTEIANSIESEKIKERSFFSEDKLIISADPNKLVRAFQNLINNGIKYGTGEFLDIYAYKKNDYAVVDVISYGNPIPAVELPYIFDKFYRVDKSRNKNDGGSGLGLAITKSIVSLHGGIITAQSDGEKTIFKVMLPLLKDKIKIIPLNINSPIFNLLSDSFVAYCLLTVTITFYHKKNSLKREFFNKFIFFAIS